MNDWFGLLRARTALVLYYLLAVAGFAPALYLVALAFLPELVPAVPPILPRPRLLAWVADRVYPALPLALIGLALMALGLALAARQLGLIRLLEQHRKDRLRRRRDYAQSALMPASRATLP